MQIGSEAQALISAVEVAGATEGGIKTGDDLDVWEHRLEERVAATRPLDTDREAIIRARATFARGPTPTGSPWLTNSPPLCPAKPTCSLVRHRIPSCKNSSPRCSLPIRLRRRRTPVPTYWPCMSVPIANIELNENMEFARPSSRGPVGLRARKL